MEKRKSRSRIIAFIAEIIVILLFAAQNFAIIFPGDPMPLGAIVFAAVYAVLNFIVCVFLIRGKCLGRDETIALLWVSISILAMYIFSGVKVLVWDLVRDEVYISVNDIERLKSLALCAVEVAGRMICVRMAPRHTA